ncbi:MAG TPA: anti-sigma factor [Gaiellaceae bacterium]|nr:anti-sigma factor [Gaiellaceae bacterium]
MQRDDIHELSAGYALDALDPADEQAFEEHLRYCERCRAELAGMQRAAVALAHAAPAAAPPPPLRGQLLDQARRERGRVGPQRPRWAVPAAACAVAAACAALGLGLWAASLHHSLGGRTDALKAQQRALAIAAAPGARRLALSGGHGALVVAPSGRAALLLVGVQPPPAGTTYEAWVVAAGAPRPAGLFAAGAGRNAIALDRPVPAGASVAVTIEPAGGSPRPTGSVVLHSPAV